MSMTEVGTVVFAGADTGATKDTTGANFLIAFGDGMTSTEVIVDNKSASNIWVAGTIQEIGSNRCRIFYCLAPVSVGSGHNIKSDNSGSSGGLAFYAFSRSGTYTFTSESGTNDGTFPGTSCQPGSLTSTSASAFYFAGARIGSENGASWAINQGFTVGHTNVGRMSGYLNQTSAGAQNPTLSWTNSSRWVAAMAMFETSGGGGSANGAAAQLYAQLRRR